MPPETSKRRIVARSRARTRCGSLCYHREGPAPEKTRRIKVSQLRRGEKNRKNFSRCCETDPAGSETAESNSGQNNREHGAKSGRAGCDIQAHEAEPD